MSADSTKQPPATPSTTNYDSETPQRLIDFMSRGWAEVPLRVGAHPQLARLQSRRDELSRKFPGCYLVIPAGQEHVRANDTNFRFRPASDFAYLMGTGEPGRTSGARAGRCLAPHAPLRPRAQSWKS